jgi:hypothetical protein
MLTSVEQKDELFSEDNGSMGYTIIYLISDNTSYVQQVALMTGTAGGKLY